MSKLLRIIVVAAFPGLVSAAHADTSVTGAYTATDTVTSGNSAYAPTINTANSFLSSPFTESLKVGQTTTPSEFIDVEPVSGGSSVGTVAGTVAVYFNFSGFSAVTNVTSSVTPGNGSLVSGGTYNGQVSVTGYYDLNYASTPDQSDCITWSSTSCTPANSNDNVVTSVGDVLTITFANNAVLAVSLYNWSDWDMQPNISFNLVTAPHSVPEPASMAVFASSLAALGVIRRRSRRSRGGSATPSSKA